MDSPEHPLERQIPPTVHATPSDVRPGPDADDEIRWWKPGFHDVVEYVGWRWLFVVPAMLLIALILLSWLTGWFVPFIFRTNPGFIAAEAKLAILAGGVALSCLVYVTRRAVRARSEPFCIYCGYNLSNLPDDYRCPECGRPYTWKLIDEYRRDPHWFIERWKLRDQHRQESAALDAGAVPRRNRARDGTE
jgi:hypothetical protein